MQIFYVKLQEKSTSQRDAQIFGYYFLLFEIITVEVNILFSELYSQSKAPLYLYNVFTTLFKPIPWNFLSFFVVSSFSLTDFGSVSQLLVIIKTS